MDSFFTGNGIDAFIGPAVNETFMGNVVGLPEMVIPVAFNPVASGSPRRNPTSVGIYALPNQDSKVIIVTWSPETWTSGVHILSWSSCCMGQAALLQSMLLGTDSFNLTISWFLGCKLHHHWPCLAGCQGDMCVKAMSKLYLLAASTCWLWHACMTGNC